jgi:hypothetical protein
VVPRDHVVAATWIQHRAWLTDPDVAPGKRNADISHARLAKDVVSGYMDRWDLLMQPTAVAPVLLPGEFRKLAGLARIGLPPGHPWNSSMPGW